MPATHNPVDNAPQLFDVNALRAREYAWMDAGEAMYFNAASTGPMPQCAIDVADQWTRLRSKPQHLPLKFMQDAVAASRRQFGQLIGADEDEIALMPNTTYGLNLAARALPIKPGVILTFDGEFPSCVYPFMALREKGITLELIPKRNGLPDEDALLAAIQRPDVSAVVVSWVQFATGFVADLARIGNACQERGIYFIVDAIQGVGVREIDVHALPIDMFATGSQKWQLGPWGTGFVYVRRNLITQLEPHDVGWACMTASSDYTRLTDYQFDFYRDARRFEVITVAYHDFAVANASTKMLLDIGIANVQAHITRLADRIVEWTDSRRDVTLVTPREHARRAGVISFASPHIDDMAHRLKQKNVVFSPREGSIRLSPHCYNTMDEINETLALLDG